jgi:hypothetical protein
MNAQSRQNRSLTPSFPQPLELAAEPDLAFVLRWVGIIRRSQPLVTASPTDDAGRARVCRPIAERIFVGSALHLLLVSPPHDRVRGRRREFVVTLGSAEVWYVRRRIRVALDPRPAFLDHAGLVGLL